MIHLASYLWNVAKCPIKRILVLLFSVFCMAVSCSVVPDLDLEQIGREPGSQPEQERTESAPQPEAASPEPGSQPEAPIDKPFRQYSREEAVRRLKDYWHSDPTEEHFGMGVVRGQKEAVELFLAAGLSADSKHIGDPILCHAVSSFQYGIAEMLIEEGADVNAADTNGNPPLVIAVAQCGIPQLPEGMTTEDLNHLVQTLIDAGADIHATFRSGHTLSEMAGISKCPAIQDTLRKAGAE